MALLLENPSEVIPSFNLKSNSLLVSSAFPEKKSFRACADINPGIAKLGLKGDPCGKLKTSPISSD